MSTAKKLIAAFALAILSQSAQAGAGWFDSAAVEAGRGDRVTMVRAALQRRLDGEWFKSEGTHVVAHWDFSVAALHGTYHREMVGQTQNLAVIGATPVFRLEREDHKGWFLQGGIGFYLFSSLYNNAGNQLSTAFQFGDQVGLGYVFDNRWQLEAKVQHFSNAGLKHPNSGVNFGLVRLTVPF